MKNNMSYDISVKCSRAWVSGLKDWKLYRIKDEMEKIVDSESQYNRLYKG